MILKTYNDEFSDLPCFDVHQKQTEYSTLNWGQLYPGFYVWLVALVSCIAVFMGEIIVLNIKRIFLRRKVLFVRQIMD